MLRRAHNTSPEEYIAVFAALVLTATYFFSYIFDFGLFPLIAGIALSAFLLATFATRYKQSLLLGLSFLVPLSVPLKLPGGSVIQAPTEIICIALFLFFLMKFLSDKEISQKFLKHPITILILLDLSWILVTSFTSEMPLVSFKRFFIRLVYYTGFYFFYFELFSKDPRNIKRVFFLQCLAFLIPIISTLSFHATLGFSTMGSQLASAPFYNDHTMYGAALAFFIPFLFIFSEKTFRTKKSLIFLALVIIFSTAFFLSYSRAAWLSLMLAGFIGLIVHFRIRFSFLLILLAFIGSVVYGYSDNVRQYFESNKEVSHSNDVSMHFKSISNVNTDVSNLERVNRWKCAFRMFKDKPVTGFGPGTYQFFYGNYQVRKDMTHISTFNGNKGHAHSEYLNYLSETGLPGLLIFVTLLSIVMYKGIKLIKRSEDSYVIKIGYALTLGLVTFIIHGFFNGFIEFDKLAMPVYSAMAAITCLDLECWPTQQQHCALLKKRVKS